MLLPIRRLHLCLLLAKNASRGPWYLVTTYQTNVWGSLPQSRHLATHYLHHKQRQKGSQITSIPQLQKPVSSRIIQTQNASETLPTTPPLPAKMLPNSRLLARAFHRVPLSVASSNQVRTLSNSAPRAAWEGSKPEEHVVRESDVHNIQQDASKDGKAERASGDNPDGSTIEKDVGSENKKAKEDHPEAPEPVIGMNDERGSVSNI